LKKAPAIAFLCLACAAWAQADDLASLRDEIARALPDAVRCEAIGTFDGTRSFSIDIPNANGFTIHVREAALMTQKEWDEKSRAAKALLEKSAALKDKADGGAILKAATLLHELPGYHYRHIGVGLAANAPETYSPDNEKNEKKLNAALDRIVSLLTPYEKPEHGKK